jgi:hypothetical protein
VSASKAGAKKRYEVYRELPGEDTYGWFLNCPDDAFRTAALTLNQRIQQFGAESREVRSWAEAQEQVFANCAQGAVTPVPAPADIDPLIRADRTYQIAAAHFYTGDFDAAEAGFSEIAEDASSPWHDIAPYLVARTLIRKATLSGGYRQFDVATMTRAEDQLKRIAEDPQLETVHGAAERLLSYVRIRLHPEERLRELGAAILRPGAGETLRNDLEEYAYLLKRVHDKEPADFTDWHTLAAAAKVGPNSPGYATVAYHRLRLMVDSGREEEARRQLETLLVQQGERLPISSRNLFLALRLRLARDLDEFLKYSVHEIAGSTYYYGEDMESPNYGTSEKDSGPKSRRFSFDPAAAQFLNEQMPLGLLAQVATSGRFPQHIRRDLVQGAWVRAVILGNDGLAQRLLPALGRHVPEVKGALNTYRSATSPEARRFAAAFALLRNPGLRPYVTSGFGRDTPVGKIDSLRENWWCSLAVDARFDVPNYLKFRIVDWSRDWLKGIYPEDDEALPRFLSQGQRSTVGEELRMLRSLGAAPNYLSRQVIEWAKKNPDDPRVPQALHLAVRSTRYGCADADTSKFSKAAFQLLHRHYPKSQWAKKTKYWY